MTSDPENIFSAIPPALEEELVNDLAHGKEFRMKRIVSKGHTAPESGWYDQEEHEWVVVLQGQAKIAFDDGDVKDLSAGDYVNIPARTKHRVSWTTPDEETVWLAIHYL